MEISPGVKLLALCVSIDRSTHWVLCMDSEVNCGETFACHNTKFEQLAKSLVSKKFCHIML